MQGEGIWFQCFAYHGQHNLLGTDSSLLVETHHTQTVWEGRNTDHEYLLPMCIRSKKNPFSKRCNSRKTMYVQYKTCIHTNIATKYLVHSFTTRACFWFFLFWLWGWGGYLVSCSIVWHELKLNLILKISLESKKKRVFHYENWWWRCFKL